jgi:hypothetical protein
MTYQKTGILHSVDPATKQRRGAYIEVGTDESGNVQLRTVRNDGGSTIRLRPEMAVAVAELMHRAACGPSADPSETQQAARKMVATHLHLARELVSFGNRGDATEHDLTRAIANALANELRRGVALAKTAGGESELLAALEIGRETEEAGNGLGE